MSAVVDLKARMEARHKSPTVGDPPARLPGHWYLATDESTRDFLRQLRHRRSRRLPEDFDVDRLLRAPADDLAAFITERLQHHAGQTNAIGDRVRYGDKPTEMDWMLLAVAMIRLLDGAAFAQHKRKVRR